jgi:ribose transport system ATP-binding protein
MSSTPPLLSISHLSKTFEGQVALREVSLAIQAREIYGLVGHNGSGKSTLIKVLAGYHKPDPGAVLTLAGQDILSGSGASDQLRFIHQDLGLIQTLSAAENLAIGGGGFRTGGLHRIRWAEQRAFARESIGRSTRARSTSCWSPSGTSPPRAGQCCSSPTASRRC